MDRGLARQCAVGIAIFATSQFATACAWSTSAGRTHLVFGVGFVTTQNTAMENRATGEIVADVESITSVGVLIGTPQPARSGLMVGYSESQVIDIQRSANVIVACPGGTSGQPFLLVECEACRPVQVETSSDCAADDSAGVQ